jgi:hypothetical protein
MFPAEGMGGPLMEQAARLFPEGSLVPYEVSLNV